MAYIRTLSQADWFFNPGKTPGGLEPTGAAAPPLPGAPGAKAPAPAPAPASAPAPPAAESEDEADEPAATPEKTAAPPVLEKKKSTPIGLYLLGGIALAVVGVILYKKFGGGDDEEIEAEAPAPIERTEVIETTAPLANRKKKRS